jgi:DNA polymerase-4
MARFGTKSFGNDYAVGNKTINREKVANMLMKLCEKTGRRLRKHQYQSYGIYLGIGFEDRSWWGKSHKTKYALYSTQDIYNAIKFLYKQIVFPARVTHLNIAVFNIVPEQPKQIGIFDGTRLDKQSIAKATDKINNRYGEYTLTPASMANMQNIIIKRVPFGSVRDI